MNTELGVCLVASRGYPASDVWHVYERALELCRQLERPTAPPILRGLALASIVSGDLKRAHALGEELLGPFDQQRDPVIVVEGHYVLGVTCFWLGRFVGCSDSFRSKPSRGTIRAGAISIFRSTRRTPRRSAFAAWHGRSGILGFSEQSIAIMDDALAFAPTLGHPHTEGYVLYFAAQLAFELRNEARARELLAGLERLIRRYRLTYWEERGHILSICCAPVRGSRRYWHARARTAMAASAREGDMVNFTQYLGYAANLCLRQRSVPEGGRRSPRHSN